MCFIVLKSIKTNFVNVKCSLSPAISLSALNFCSCISTSFSCYFFFKHFISCFITESSLSFSTVISILSSTLNCLFFSVSPKLFLDSLSLNTVLRKLAILYMKQLPLSIYNHRIQKRNEKKSVINTWKSGTCRT